MPKKTEHLAPLHVLIPHELMGIIEQYAENNFTKKSNVVRQFIVKQLRDEGYIFDVVESSNE